VLHALEKQRGARPQTASELAREFKTATQPGAMPQNRSSESVAHDRQSGFWCNGDDGLNEPGFRSETGQFSPQRFTLHQRVAASRLH